MINVAPFVITNSMIHDFCKIVPQILCTKYKCYLRYCQSLSLSASNTSLLLYIWSIQYLCTSCYKDAELQVP